jgi:putative tryptophan/tyrosine transport system substrate-binding protein
VTLVAEGHVQRRKFITLLGGATASTAWPLSIRAQQSAQIRRIGVLMGYAESDPAVQSYLAAFRGALAKLGWTDGSNLRIELRWGAADPDRMKTFAKELVDLRPDAILGTTTPVISALARETQTTPIVFAIVIDPIGSGFVASLAHPGGNITGFTTLDPALGSKWVGLLKEIAPHTVRAALLFNPTTASPLQIYMPSIQAAATSLAVEVSAAPVHAKNEIEGVIAAQARNPGGSLIVMPDIFNRLNRDLIIALAARYGVPAIYYSRALAESGGLIAYSDDFAEELRQAADYIDRILRGSRVGGLPIQQPTKFELVINMKTAKALGLTLSSGLLSIADEVIE